jgi:asparagine synthase (glutamine-hydrolysing)
MCGILGTIPSTDNSKFKKALDTLYHRGPDDYGVKNVGNSITLGHRRLSIVDLSSKGHQPMSDITSRYTLTFNGEIYNFIEIRKELIKKGYSFFSQSDTEVVLYSYIEWGDKCVNKFNGMWAFAIWDSLKAELFLSRDRFGKKPLFYAVVNGKFIFASEMKAIYPFLRLVKPSKDFNWMKNNIFLYESTDKCLVDGIKRFPFGHNGIYKDGKLSIFRYWNTLDNLVNVSNNYDDHVERFNELFIDACKIRMRSDVPIGTALSGGLDSSATISAMAYISESHTDYASKDWQHAFVAAFPGTPLDESYYAKVVADNIDIEAKFVDINPLKYWENLEDYFYKFEELYITSPIPMLMLYSEVKKSGVTVTLDGHGADELFSGYGHLLEALWDSKFSFANTIDILNTHIETQGDNAQFSRSNKLSMYLKYMAKKSIKDLLGKGHISKDYNHVNFKKLDNFSQHLYVIFHETILPTLLRNYDRYSMMNGVEIRMPFMDHRIVTYVNSLPYTSKFGNGYTKILIRDAMSRYMPKEITWRKSKIGFNTPIVDWMQKDLKEWFADTVHDKSFINSQLVDNPKKLQKSIMNIVNKKENRYTEARKCWTQLTPYIWEKSIINRVNITK